MADKVNGVTVLEQPLDTPLPPAVPKFYADADIVDLFGDEPRGLVMQLLKRAQAAEAAIADLLAACKKAMAIDAKTYEIDCVPATAPTMTVETVMTKMRGRILTSSVP